LKNVALGVSLAIVASGCAKNIHEAVAVSCFEYIGRPISERVAALGPPKFRYRIDATRVGYAFEASETQFIGHERYYSVNYLTGVDNHRTPIRAATTTCRGTFVVRDDGLPGSQRIIVDIVPSW
jgi:hypothetical protein